MKVTLIAEIASTIQALKTCIERGNSEWIAKHEDHLDHLAKFLPDGSGFNNGTSIDVKASTAGKVILNTSFHHMDEGGVYDGWTEHKVVITPTFSGIDTSISGRNRNDIKEYIAEVLHSILTEQREQTQWYPR